MPSPSMQEHRSSCLTRLRIPSILDHRFEFLLQQPHGLLTIEENPDGTQSTVQERTIGLGEKDCDLRTAHGAGSDPDLPQRRLHHYGFGLILILLGFFADICEVSEPIALMWHACFHRSSLLEIHL
jgi:hypothetical protein